MKKNGKKYEAALKLVDTTKQYSLEEAAALLKKTSVTKFDSTIDVSFKLNVDPTQADQLIRGTLVLPHGRCPDDDRFRHLRREWRGAGYRLADRSFAWRLFPGYRR